jgi:hypothetical protein
MPGLPPSGGKDRHYLHVPIPTFRAHEIEQLGNVNEDRLIRQSQFIEGHFCPMSAFHAPAMDGESSFASRSGISDCFRRLEHVAR